MLYADPLEPKWLEAWSTFGRILKAFAAEVRAHGSQFAVLSVPAGHVVDGRVWNQVMLENAGMASRRWQPEGPEQRLRTLAAEAAVRLETPLDAFRAQLDGPPLFFGGIGHMTPRGHEVMAAFLEDTLQAQGLLPEATRRGADR